MSSATDERPNIVFVFTDQQSADMMSCAGNPFLETPAMDALADSGVRFERTYCASPVCSPSRTSLMTGRFPSDLNVRSNDHRHLQSVPEEIPRGGMGHLLQEAGYDTAYGGKVHLPEMTLVDLGFEYITDDERDGLVEACAEYVRRDREDPFFLVASFINPHDICYMAIRDYREEYPDYEGPEHAVAEAGLDEALRPLESVTDAEFVEEHCPPLPENHESQRDEPEAIRRMVERRPFRAYAREEWSDERWRLHRRAYARLTELVDAQIVRLLDAVDECTGGEETVVIFTSDHGDMDGAHELEHKSAIYEEAARVPLVVSQPERTVPGAVDEEHLVSNGLDLLPTVCDYAGIDPPTIVRDGVSGCSPRETMSTSGATTCGSSHRSARPS